jgi:putative ABC transport system permease protein
MISQDFRFSIRLLAARPAFAFSAIGIVGTAIALTGVVFALADPFVLRELPYPSPDRLISVEVRQSAAPNRAQSLPRPAPSVADLKARTDVFDVVAAYRHLGSIRGRIDGTAVALRMVTVSPELPRLLGLPKALNEGQDSLVLTTRAASRASSIAERSAATFLRSDGTSVPIMGVLPPSFLFPTNHYAFPIDALLITDTERGDLTAGTVIAKLQGSASVVAARAAIAALVGPGEFRTTVQPLWMFMAGRNRTLAWGALAAVALIFLLSVANVGTLLLTHSVTRSSEVVLRFVLGASASRLFQLLFAEVLLITVASLAIGLLLVAVALPATGQLAPLEYVALGAPRLDHRVAVATTTAAIVFAIIASLLQWATWLWSIRAGVSATKLAVATPRVKKISLLSAIAQATTGTVLITGAALLTRSYVGLTSQDPGMDDDVLVATTSYPDDLVGTPLQHSIESTIDRLRRIPDIDGVAAAIGPMVDRTVVTGGFPVNGTIIAVTPFQVSPEYFHVVGARIVAGRQLTTADRRRAGIIVNEQFSKVVWPNDNAIGQRAGYRGESEVVGVVRDAFTLALDMPPTPAFYSLIENPVGCKGDCNRVSFLAHTRDLRDPQHFARQMTDAIRAADGSAIVTGISTVGKRLTDSIKDRTFATVLLDLMGVVSVIVCAMGLAGLIAFIVRCRARELAIRSALGADRGHLLGSILGQALSCVIGGIMIGLLGAAWMSQSLESVLYGVPPGDPLSLTWALVVMVAVTLGATCPPALRALRISPATIMKSE